MARLNSRVTVHTKQRGSVVLNPDEHVPDWAVALISNPGAWDVPPTQEEIERSESLIALDRSRAEQDAADAIVTPGEISRSQKALEKSRAKAAHDREAAEVSRQIEETQAAERKRQMKDR